MYTYQNCACFSFVQLMYKFVAKVGENIPRTMSLNWQQMCKTVLPSIDGEMTLDEEKQVLARVTKNIYHRKPSILPIVFSKVSSKKADFRSGGINNN